MSIVTMIVPCGFKIKSKVDIDKFMNEIMCKGNEYYIKVNKNFALYIRKEKDGSFSVAEKHGDLYDMFNPLLEVANTKNNSYKISVRDYLWRNRKYINAKWFND